VDDQSKTKQQLIQELDDLRQQVVAKKSSKRATIKRQHAEQALRDGELKLKTLLNATTDLAYLAESDGTLLAVNDAMAKSLGQKKEDLIGQSMFEYFSAKVAKHRKSVLQELVRSKKPFQGEDENAGRHFDHSAYPIFDDNGNVIQIAGFSRDITENKRTVNLLRIQRDLGSSLSKNVDFYEVLHECLSAGLEVSEMDCGAIYIVDPTTGAMDIRYHKGLSKKFLAAVAHYEADSPITKIVMTGKPIYTSHEALEAPLENIRVEENLKAFAVVPVMFGNQVVGCLNTASHSLEEVPQLTRNSLETIVSQIGDAIANKQAKQARQESEERYRLLAENVIDVIWTSDLDLRLTYVSPSVEKLRGFSPEEVINQAPDQRMTADSLVLAAKTIAEELTNEGKPGMELDRSRTIELETTRKDGSTVWTEVTARILYDKEGNPKGMLGVTRNIDARKRFEKHLAKLNECFLRLGPDPVENINTFTALCGELLGATCALYNKLEQGMLFSLGQWQTPPGFNPRDKPDGHISQDVIRNQSDEIFLVRDLPNTKYAETDVNVERYDLKTYCGKAVKFRNEYVGSICVLFRDDYKPDENEIKVLSIIASAIGVEEERLHSNTEKEKLAAQLYQADKMTTVGLLAAGLAHEINNPIGYVLPNLQLLQEQITIIQEIVNMHEKGTAESEIAKFKEANNFDDVMEEIPQILSDCLEGAGRVSNTTKELRQFSRMDDGTTEEVDLSDLLDSSLTIAANEIKFRATVIKKYSDIPNVMVNRGKMSQVFLNIIVNAGQAIEEGHVKDNWIQVKTGRKADKVFVEIANSGPTIPPDIIPKIFDPFFTTKPQDQGTGLGLSISYSIVQQHKGTIEVESSAELGTIFRVWLPHIKELETQFVEAPAPEAETEISGRILIVDDEQGILRYLGMSLDPPHSAVLTASGQEALEVLERDQAFDVVLCDLMMPELSGMELLDRVRSDHPQMAPRFIFMTGGAFTPRAGEFVKSIDNQILDKPLELERLRSAIRKLMAEQQSPLK
jgi:PAS domain S-box-containing protein